MMTPEGWEGNLRFSIQRLHVRIYAGHTARTDQRARTWRSDLSRGAFIRPWSDRVFGIQWRRTR